MCRLMGYVSPAKTSFPALVGDEFVEFVALSSVHCDGWGLSTIDKSGAHTVLERKVEAAATSASFDTSMQTNVADGALLHLRWATKGISISENNTHPFMYEDYSFIHNGSIFPPDAIAPYIDSKFSKLIVGDGDSEQYFYLVLTEIEKHGLIGGLKSALSIIKTHADTTSLNCMIMNREFFATVSEHNSQKKPDWAPDDYYEIKYLPTPEGVLFASSGWNQPGWSTLDNHHAAIVNRSTFEIEVIGL
jgi:predicted glutamine amidotransferase